MSVLDKLNTYLTAAGFEAREETTAADNSAKIERLKKRLAKMDPKKGLSAHVRAEIKSKMDNLKKQIAELEKADKAAKKPSGRTPTAKDKETVKKLHQQNLKNVNKSAKPGDGAKAIKNLETGLRKAGAVKPAVKSTPQTKAKADRLLAQIKSKIETFKKKSKELTELKKEIADLHKQAGKKLPVTFGGKKAPIRRTK